MHACLISLILVATTTLSSAGSVKRIGGQRPIGIREKPSGLKQIGSRLSASRSKEPTLDPNEWLVYTNATLRTWTSVTATEVEATLIRFNQSQVILKSGENKPVSIARSRLSADDNTFLTNIEKSHQRKLTAKWRAEQNRKQKSASSTGCPNCSGAGWIIRRVTPVTLGGALNRKRPTPKVNSKIPCRYCDGTGRYSRSNSDAVPSGYFTCHFCGGRGCDWCNGKGKKKLNQSGNEASNPFAGSGR